MTVVPKYHGQGQVPQDQKSGGQPRVGEWNWCSNETFTYTDAIIELGDASILHFTDVSAAMPNENKSSV